MTYTEMTIHDACHHQRNFTGLIETLHDADDDDDDDDESSNDDDDDEDDDDDFHHAIAS